MTTMAPTPPGALGIAAQPGQVLSYLGSLENWIRQRRAELDSIDAEVISSGRQAELTADVALAMSLWQAVRTRQELVLQTWDSGRVAAVELERISGLIWGRLDATVTAGQPVAASLPEACRLCDAIVAQLRARLNTDPQAEQQVIRLRTLRAQAERIRDQIGLEPSAAAPVATARLNQVLARLGDLEARRERGADIGGLLGTLEIEAARFERDLIVGAAQRREAIDLLTTARERRAALQARQEALAGLADGATAALWPVPRIQVPDLAELGTLPNTAAALTDHLSRLGAFEAGLGLAEQQWSAALTSLDAARGLPGVLRAKADSLGVAQDPLLLRLLTLAEDTLAFRPAPLPVGEALLAACRARLDQLQDTGGAR